MKKFFTYLAMAVMGASALTANAETVTANFQTFSAGTYHDYYKPFELEIVKNSDGSYSMPNFMNSGSDVSFTFNEPKVGKYAQITVTSPYEVVATATDWEWGDGYEDYYALLDENGDALELSEVGTTGETKVLFDPILYTAEDGYMCAYIKKLDTTDGKNEYEYYADFSFLAYSDDDEDDWGNNYYLRFYFGKANEGSGADEPVDVQGEKVIANFQTFSAGTYHDYYKPFELEIVKNADGSYSMPNFMNSGAVVSFTFKEPKVGKYAQITVTSPYEVVATDWEWGDGYEDYYALLDENGDALELSEANPAGVTKVLFDPILYTAEDGDMCAYIKKLDTTDGKNEYEYYADFSFLAYSDDDEDDWGNNYYLRFYFGKANEGGGADEPVDVQGENIIANFKTYSGENYYKPFELEIVKNANGSYSMPNFMNSGSAVNFTFDVPEVGDYAEIKITSPYEVVATDWDWGVGYEDYYALLDENGDALELSEVNPSDETKVLFYPIIITTFDDNSLGAYVKKLDTTDGKNEYEYYADFPFIAYSDDDDDDYGNYYYMTFYFGKVNNTSAVTAISVDENAPVEYYNLSGIRVDKPSNGIFIRKQGNDVKKVIVR